MSAFRAASKWYLLSGVILFAAVLVAWSWHSNIESTNDVPEHRFELSLGKGSEWSAAGGDWKASDGIIYNTSAFRGAHLVAGSTRWHNYTLHADLRFVGETGDVGVVVRSNYERKGADAYDGYFIGVRTFDGSYVIGRSNFRWSEANPLSIPGGARSGVWYRFTVTAYECNIAASFQDLTTLKTSWVALKDPSCIESGRIGLRSLSPGGEWRNISIEPATWDDYLALRQHAGTEERLDLAPGPPWWTPWHAAMLFGGLLAFALLAQLIYFRTQQWKAYTLTRERERLAHDIHDTMAQSFAGIGYQIQGIRHSVVRSTSISSNEVAEQLEVAYQLVRRCHEEASRTIAMLGSPSLKIQRNLLGALGETAKKIAGEQIDTVVEQRGNPTSLNLRVADALLHIGREAVVNAVGHANPTGLKISLGFEENGVELTVEDNGCGFDYVPEMVGFGILGMQKRVREVRGSLEIISEPSHGTRIHARVPLHRERRLKKIFEKPRALATGILRGRDEAGVLSPEANEKEKARSVA